MTKKKRRQMQNRNASDFDGCIKEHGDKYLEYLEDNAKRLRQAEAELRGDNMRAPPEKDYL